MSGPESSGAEIVTAVASLIQVVFIGLAGLGGLYAYLRTRRGQVRIGISASSRILRSWTEESSLLLVKLHLVNTSNVIYYHREATATLMDARKQTASGEVRLAPFKQADPLPPVYGDMNTSPRAVQEGRLFQLDPAAVSLEPGEHVDTEIAFLLDPDKLGLMALRVLIRGRQRRWLLPKDYWWGTFFFISPDAEVLSLSSGLSDEENQ